MGKPTIFSKGEVETACSLTNFVAGQVEQAYGQTSLNVPGHLNFSLRQPFGVVAAIIPWNFPTAIVCLTEVRLYFNSLLTNKINSSATRFLQHAVLEML